MPVATAPGLSSAVAAARRAAEGPNLLPAPRRPSAARRFLGELTHFFAIMLWVAGGLALLARLPELGIAIFAAVATPGGDLVSPFVLGGTMYLLYELTVQFIKRTGR